LSLAVEIGGFEEKRFASHRQQGERKRRNSRNDCWNNTKKEVDGIKCINYQGRSANSDCSWLPMYLDREGQTKEKKGLGDVVEGSAKPVLQLSPQKKKKEYWGNESQKPVHEKRRRGLV